jgi:hypothetical protein
MHDSLFDAEAMIADWRRYLEQRRALADEDIDELEDHLRGQSVELQGTGLSEEEALFVAIRRLGKLDAISHEYALEHTERLWKQLVMGSGSATRGTTDRELLVVLLLAAAAAFSFKIWDLSGLFALHPDQDLPLFYLVHAPYFVVPWLCGYFFWKRSLQRADRVKIVPPLVAGLVVMNVYPFIPLGDTHLLGILHLPIALWLVVGFAHAGDRWQGDSGRMDFVRFTGELMIYYSLIALGGGVFMALTVMLFSSIGLNPAQLVFTWILPCGATGAVLVAAWLVESKQGVIENIAPVLTRVFTPLFTLLLAGFLVTKLFAGQDMAMERDVLIIYDIVLAMVLGLLLYALSARDLMAPPGWFDRLQLTLVVCALLADLIALAAIAGRITEFGFTPNRLAVLGENLILLVNLGWSAVLYRRFIQGQQPFAALVHWQMVYLPVYAVWAAAVVILFPPLFGFV